MSANVNDDYYAMLAYIESGGQPNAKAPTSSASGLFQFTKSIWTSLGGHWGNDPSQPFGGYVPTNQEQIDAASKLTQQNANYLQTNGIPVNNNTLYTAHFLGAPAAKNVLSSDPSTPMSSVVSPNVITANPFLKNFSVGDFSNWVDNKIGGASGSPGSGGFLARARRSYARLRA